MLRINLTILALVGLACGALADTLVLHAGDQLHGQLVRIQDETLVFRTELAGQVIVPIEEVAAVSTDRSMIFELNDGRTLPATLVVSDAKQFLVEPARDVRLPIALADIRKTASLPYNAKSPGDSQPSLLNPEWRTTTELGVAGHLGTNDYVAPYAQISLRHEADDSDFNSYLRLEIADDDLPDHVRAALEWNLHRDRAWYPQLYLEAERNTDEGRNARIDAGAGVGRVLHTGKSSRLTGSLGLGLNYEDLDTDVIPGNDDFGSLQDSEHHQTDLNLRLQLRYTTDLYAGALWEKRLELYPSLTDLGELRVRYETALWVPLTPRLKLKLNAGVGYDTETELHGIHEWESTLGASVSLDF